MNKNLEEKKKYIEIADKIVVKLSSGVFRGDTLIDLVIYKFVWQPAFGV